MMNTRGSCSICGSREFTIVMLICIFSHAPLTVGISNWPVFKEQATTLQCEKTSECPTWFGCSNGTCECNSQPENIIRCDIRRAAVLACHCVTKVTSDEFSSQELVVGSCIFNCGRRPNHTIIDPSDRYFVLPYNISSLNEDMCGRFKRTGPLCGKCLPDHRPKVYSYSLKCIECPHAYSNWLLFIVTAFAPLTIFYIIILLLNINIASSSTHALVLFCQLVSSPPFARVIENSGDHSLGNIATKLFMSFYGIWNLDFFRFFLPSICLNTSSLLSLSLDYIVAIYPLFLVFLTYALITLYDKNFKALVIVCKPFKLCFSWFQERHRTNTTIIDAFVTFFVLSFVKIVSVSVDLLIPVNVYSFSSSEITRALFYDGSIEYFSKKHLPFAIAAILFLIIFMMIPVIILLFYPYHWFQWILNCLPSRWYLVLQVFVDSFQGCYKNGTEQSSHDYQSFAGLYLVLRVVALLVYVFTLQSSFYFICGILFLFFSMLLLALQPYKLPWYTNLNAAFVILIVMLWFALAGLSFLPNLKRMFVAVTLLCLILPMIYSTSHVLYWLYQQRKKMKKYLGSLLLWLRSRGAANKGVVIEVPLPYDMTETYKRYTD